MGMTIGTSAHIAAVACPMIGRARVEKVVALVVDTRGHLLRALPVAQGGVAGCAMPVREILALALRHDGAGLAVAHNHPSGSTDPSPEDERVTARLDRGAEQVGLRLLDHVIVAGDDWRSLTASG